jgi:hypothetical protein
MLHPLLTSTQEGNYVGSENIGGIPIKASFWRIRTRLNGSPLRTIATTRLLSTGFR